MAAENLLGGEEEGGLQERVLVVCQYVPVLSLTALFRLGSSALYCYHPALPFQPSPATAITLTAMFNIAYITVAHLVLVRVRPCVPALRPLTPEQLVQGFVGELTTVSLWGHLGRQGSRAIQGVVAAAYLLLHSAYISWLYHHHRRRGQAGGKEEALTTFTTLLAWAGIASFLLGVGQIFTYTPRAARGAGTGGGFL